jgi:AcrR family transcriptional regulator
MHSWIAIIDPLVNSIIVDCKPEVEEGMTERIAKGVTVTAKEKSGNGVRRRERRKEDRPVEIIEAAIELFSERGFGATRLEDVARCAGVSKGTVFVYFANKEELFRAVAQTVLGTRLMALREVAGNLDVPVTRLVPALLGQAVQVMESGLPAMIRLLIAESRQFPDLAKVWYDEVVSKILALLVEAVRNGQARGEIRDGDPQLFAMSIVSPMFALAMFREVFSQSDAPLPDFSALAQQHAKTILSGMLEPAVP